MPDTPTRRQPKISDAKRAEMKAIYLDRPSLRHVSHITGVAQETAAKYCEIDGWDKIRSEIQERSNRALVDRLSKQRVRDILTIDHVLQKQGEDATAEGKSHEFNSQVFDRLARLREYLQHDAIEDRDDLMTRVEKLITDAYSPTDRKAAITSLRERSS